MKNKYLLLVVFFIFISNIICAQNTFDITFPGSNSDKKCQQCFKIFKKKPKGVKFSIKREKSNLYFEVNDKKWFNLLFKNSGDGVAIDIVLKDRYECSIKSISNAQIRGLLLKPVYSEELRKGLNSSGENAFRTYVGKIPEGFLDSELEYNILFLNNKNLCRYYVIYDLDTYSSDLLDMGMYLDSLAYETKQVKSLDGGAVIRRKTLKFKIPFKKNKSNYSQSDIKPLYDSLRLTNFNIKAIKIKAYSSIEGVAHRNTQLQKLRAKSIVAALQSFQKPTIKTTVSTSENWVDFLNDIKNTRYSPLLILNKEKIKERLSDGLSKEMEPILKNHRIAVVELELEKKDKHQVVANADLLQKFKEAISAGNVDEASGFQNSIFERIRANEMSDEVLKELIAPKEAKFIEILNKNSAYKYVLDFKQALIVYNELLEYEKMAPNNRMIKYNIAAIKIQLWRYNAIKINEESLKKEINALKKYNIKTNLIKRMLVNYNIVMAENYMRNKDYDKKDEAVEFVNRNYKKFHLSDYDYLSLAQFFSYYSDNKLAVKLLDNIVKSIDVDEDLLFYYLNLTLIDKELTQDYNYRIVLLNAYNMNKERFCKLFNSVENGGVTFQLLEYKFIRRTYCENCNN